MIKYRMILIAVLIGLAACRPAPTALPSATVAATRTPARPATAVPTATKVATSTPTRTPVPATATATPAPTDTSAPSPTPTTMATATPFPTSPAKVNEVQFEVAGQVGGQSRAVAVTWSQIYVGIGPRIAGLGNTLRLAGLSDSKGFSPPLPGIVNDMVVDEEAQIAYVAAGDAGLLIVDVSFLPIARILGSVATANPAQAVAVRDGLAVVAEGEPGGQGGASVVDVSQPDAPERVAYRRLPAAAHGVEMGDGYAYLVYESGLIALDLSDPEAPVETSRVPLSQGGNDIAFDGGYAYVAGDGLRILSLADPAQPLQVGHLGTTFRSSAVTARDGRAYLVDAFCEMGNCGSTLHVVDVRDPAHPQEIGSWFTHSAVEDLAVFDEIAYLASWQNGIEAVDVRDPANPKLLDAYGTLGEVTDVVVDGGFAYVSDGAESGLRVLDLATSPRGRVWPTVRGRAEMRWAGGYAVRDGLAYVPAWSAGLYIVNVSDPDTPRELWTRDIGQAAAAVVVDDIAYVSVLDGLVVIDVSDPGAPEELSRLSLAGSAAGLAVREGIAYVAVEGSGGGDVGTFYVVDVHDPGDPEPVSEAALEGRGLDVALAGDVAYVAVRGQSGRTPRGGVQAVDVSDPGQPRTIGFLLLPGGAFDVQVSGAYAFVAGGEAGVYVADLADPANLRLVGHVDTPGSARRVAVVADRVYVADEAGGLIVLQTVQ